MSAVTFDYLARDASGARKTGRITARDRADAAAQLKSEGLLPVRFTAAGGSAAAAPDALSLVQAVELTGRLARLTGRSVPLDRALSIVGEGEGPAGAAARAAHAALRGGAGAAAALSGPGGLTDPACRSLVASAEISGEMGTALESLHAMLSARLALRRRMLTGLLYPAVLLVVASASVLLILGVIVPQFRPLVADRMDMVPLLGRAVFAASGAISALWPLMLTAGMAVAAMAFWASRTGRLAIWADRGLGRLPGIRGHLAKGRRTRLLMVLAALLERKVTLTAALTVLVETSEGTPEHAAISAALASVEGGTPLWRALSEADLVAGDARETIRVGEEVGDLPAMTARAAEDMQQNQDRSTERFLTLFQPALIVGVGALIGVSLYALFAAITAVNAISF